MSRTPLRVRIWRTVFESGTGPISAFFTDAELATLSPEDRAALVARLTEVISDASQARQSLLNADDPTYGNRRCETCDGAINGRADRRYCSSTCRVRAHRTASR